MRITVLANRDLASNIALNQLIKKAPHHNYTVLLSSSVGNSDSRADELRTLKFVEQTLINRIVFPLMDNHPNHDFSLTSFAGFRHKGISISDIDDINSRASLQTLAARKPHLILSIRFGQILHQRAIDIPEFGVLNLHSGKLPQFRGVMATFWAMYQGKSTIGTTLHYIDSAKIDAGPIISIAEQPVNYQLSYLSNLLSLYPAGIEQMIEAMETIRLGAIPETLVGSGDQGGYYSFPDEKALAEFKQKGLKLIDYDEIVQICQNYW